MCDLILSTVSNVDFVKLLYGDDSNQDAVERAQVFLDLYLNTPDKSLNETPLHFASKFGAMEVVELLVMYKGCNKMAKNKYGSTPNMMVCERCTAPQAVKDKMAALLEETFYVPVLRAVDGCTVPVVGEPFSPTTPPVSSQVFLNGNLMC